MKTEFEQYDHLKKELDKENDNIIISQLVNSKLNQKVSHVNVKVFNDIVELFNLYHGELKSGFHKRLKWLLSITVRTENLYVNKTVSITNKIPILEIFPIEENIINCVVEASLILPANEKWTVIKLDTIHVDISYHFQTYKETRKLESKANNVLHVTKCYNEELNIQNFKKPLLLEYKLVCHVENNHFIQSVLRNCYHQLEIELFSELGNDTDSEFILQFTSGVEKHILIYDKKRKKCINQVEC
ncbi:hypothetical protein NQ314_007026 [Rhamnusium bicolor]|uniref:RNA polymerase alpha subunit n=1 Tax=Rhamnusium bicolor TaxID=1586634 RepID=A0AAV8YSU6_9CUCU|nr:hypothetical protein NQ314_007026 [Rhamnusium bicolor]